MNSGFRASPEWFLYDFYKEVMRDAESETRRLKPECGSEKPEEGFEPFITKPVVAERMDVEIRTVTRLMRRGVLRYYKVGPMVRFKWSEVEGDLREHFHVCFDPRRAGPLTREVRSSKPEVRRGCL